NARLDLADEVRTNVGCLRVDAATDAGEERDRAGTHAEAADDAGKPDEITVGNGARTLEEEPDADAEQAERCDREAHDCAAEERDAQRLGLAFLLRGRGSPHVRAGRRRHAEEAGED